MRIDQELHPKRRGVGARNKLFAALFAAVLAALTLAIPALAATPPVFPNNIVVFPQRDFVVLEGYQDHVNETATITVTRNGVVSGQAQGTIAAGDPALEINHPGGVCWGTGDGAPNVTPNIKRGDVVTAKFQDGRSDSTKTLSPAVTGFTKVGTNQLVVNGTVGADVNKAFIEQRVINPDLDTTDVGRRDIRAPSRPGPYTSSLTFPTATTFRATYTFQDGVSEDGTAWTATEMRDIAAAGQMRVLSWQKQTPAGDRQGITIYEFGELGGPGMGGCPDGPEKTAPNAPRNVAATAGDSSVTATWLRSTVIPDGSAVTGYRVTAVNQASNVQTSVNVAASARTATVPDLTNGQTYRVQVRALSAAGTSQAGTAGPVTPRAPTP